MRDVPYPDDFDRLRDAVRDELTVQHGIAHREIDGAWLDSLADMVLARIEQGFDMAWRPKWVSGGAVHRWAEGDEHFVECLKCRRITAHTSQATADAWSTEHRHELPRTGP